MDSTENRVAVAVARKHLQFLPRLKQQTTTPDALIAHTDECPLCKGHLGQLKATGYTPTSQYQRAIMALAEESILFS
ncbi:MAG: hypothetical protein Q8R08_02420 [bacterium]|nr:hypothetical protein [bacterium]